MTFIISDDDINIILDNFCSAKQYKDKIIDIKTKKLIDNPESKLIFFQRMINSQINLYVSSTIRQDLIQKAAQTKIPELKVQVPDVESSSPGIIASVINFFKG